MENTTKSDKTQTCMMIARLVKTLPAKTSYAQTVKDNLAQKGIEVKLSTIYQVGSGRCYHAQIIEEIVHVVKGWGDNQLKLNQMLSEALKKV